MLSLHSRKVLGLKPSWTGIHIFSTCLHEILLSTKTNVCYRDKPVGVESVDKARHEPQLTCRCQDMEVEVCDRAEWRPMKTKPADKERGMTSKSLRALLLSSFGQQSKR